MTFESSRAPSRHSWSWTILALAALPTTIAFSCASPLGDSVIMGGALEDGSSGSGFVDPGNDGGADGSSADGATVPMCATSECPAPYATCPGLPMFKCETNLSNDTRNCGACGHDCFVNLPYELHIDRVCVDGECRGTCQSGWADCNGVPDDGCEVDPRNDPANCAGCGIQCPEGDRCIDGRCGCPDGQLECNGECKDVTRDTANCGACGYDCNEHPVDGGVLAPNMVMGCVDARCKAVCNLDLATQSWWADCNGLSADGCELNLWGSPENCGQCGKTCPPDQVCSFGTDGIGCHSPSCPQGRTVCNDYCVDLERDPMNCGSCGYSCPSVQNGTPTCDHARCAIACVTGFADCNGRPDDGCESDLAKDPRHCGACEVSCDNGIGQPCVAGQCATTECDGGKVVQ